MNIEAGPGYRLLKEGEVIQKGDEALCSSGAWENAHPTTNVGFKWHSRLFVPFRRKIEPQEGWIKFIDREPAEKDWPLWVYNSQYGCTMYSPSVDLLPTRCTHWQPAHIPAPPPVEDPVEKAFDDWWHSKNSPCGGSKSHAHAAFKAGIEWQKQQKQ